MEPSTQTAMMTFENVSKSYAKGVVLNGLNYSLKQGQVTGLLGRNGAGKSTLMKMALGLVLPQFGEITTLGEPAKNLSDKAKNRLGYVAQNFTGFDGMNALNAFRFMSEQYDNWDHEYNQFLCDKFELSVNTHIQKLSGGQKQLVAIIMALSHKPDLLILDEPVSALDPINRREFLSQVIDLAIEHGSTVLFSTHITQDIERIASDVCFLSDGHVALEGELETLKDSIFKLPENSETPKDAKLLRQKDRHKIIQVANSESLPSSAQALNLDELFIALN